MPPGTSHRALFERCSNWGRWGGEDQRGTLNFMDTAAVLRGISDRSGRRDSAVLRRMPTPSAGDQGMSGPVRLEVYQSGSAGRDALDTVCLTPHGFDMTHVDAVGHSFFAGRAYNENWRDHVFSPNGLRSGGVDALAGGIVTWWVLLDVAGQKGVEALDPGEGISGEDLGQCREGCRGRGYGGGRGLRACGHRRSWARSGRATRRLARCSSGVVAPPLCLGLFR